MVIWAPGCGFSGWYSGYWSLSVLCSSSDTCGKMTTIIIKKANFKLDNKILDDLGYTLKLNEWRKKIEISRVREEIERLQVLKIPDIEIVLD